MGGEGNFPRSLKALCVVERGDVGHRVVGFRDPVERSWYEVEFGPDRLARDGSDVDAPAVGECLDDEESATAPACWSGVDTAGSCSPRVSVTSIRRSSSRWVVRPSWKFWPGTRPWTAALAAGSATMCAAGSQTIPQSPRCAVARRRASLAPRRVGESNTVNCRTGAECSVRVISWVTSLSVAAHAYREQQRAPYVRRLSRACPVLSRLSGVTCRGDRGLSQERQNASEVRHG
ncbi:hypothetical protein SAMN02787144_102367 [Streptomyces atratus]|uniref:Uncharacterized protein n=1 Tax=Streptomyces atratus TaxID=1893 RepID=A0A1K2EUL3_STRAR|nr:hypothetical protein SAMN02787144_102367 [Streptomyces atratus]